MSGYYSAPAYVIPSSGKATAAGVCGLLVFFTCGISAIPAVILGHLAWKDTRSGRRGGHSMAVVGLILGYLVVVPVLAFLLFSVFASLIGAAGVGTGAVQ